MIDIINVLNEYGTHYTTTGKNTSPGWVNIKCCFCADSSTHLGINMTSGAFHCWKCRATGSLEALLIELYDIDEKKARRIIWQNGIEDTPGLAPVQRKTARKDKSAHVSIIPSEATVELPEEHRAYLRKRRYNPDFVHREYRLYACHLFGDYKWRLIVPIIMEHRIVNFDALSIAGANKKSKQCPTEKALVARNACLYNIDNANDTIVVVEGIFDAWRIGAGAVATLGTSFSSEQVLLIANKKPERIFIMLDSDAYDTAKKLAGQLAHFVKYVEILKLNEGDPDDMTDEEAQKLRNDIRL